LRSGDTGLGRDRTDAGCAKPIPSDDAEERLDDLRASLLVVYVFRHRCLFSELDPLRP
jgi:hypothetical protein